MTVQPIQKYNFETGVYRPPSEGGSDSLLIRVTRNCHWNHCTFCSMYKNEEPSMRSPQEVNGDIDSMADICNGLKEYSHKLNYAGEINREVALAMINQNPELNTNPGFLIIFHCHGCTFPELSQS